MFNERTDSDDDRPSKPKNVCFQTDNLFVNRRIHLINYVIWFILGFFLLLLLVDRWSHFWHQKCFWHTFTDPSDVIFRWSFDTVSKFTPYHVSAMHCLCHIEWCMHTELAANLWRVFFGSWPFFCLVCFWCGAVGFLRKRSKRFRHSEWAISFGRLVLFS